MRAAVLVDEGEPEDALVVREVPRPEPGVGEVRVRVSHAALNRLDVWIRRGLPSVPKPRVTGADAVGWIERAGAGADSLLAAAGLEVGDRVVLDPGASCGACRACARGETSLCPRFRVLGEHVDGTLAEFVVVPATAVHAAPEHLDDAQAATLGLTFATAWRMLFTRARLQPTDRVLVWGGASGVGTAALQLCTALGVETLATTRSEDKVAAMRELGASHVVVTGSGDDQGDRVVQAAAEAFGAEGVDIAFDHLGKVAWEPSMAALRRGGTYVTCGATTGASPRAGVTRLFWKQLSMLGSTMASRSDVRDMLDFVRRHEIVPLLDSTWELDEVVEAHRRLEGSDHVGKLAVRVAAQP